MEGREHKNKQRSSGPGKRVSERVNRGSISFARKKKKKRDCKAPERGEEKLGLMGTRRMNHEGDCG